MTLSARAADRLDPKFLRDCCQIELRQVWQIQERQDSGSAEVRVELSESRECLRLQAESSGWFNFLQEKKCADCALLVLTQEGSCEAHIVECKLVLGPNSWSEIKRQFLGALLRLHALAQCLELRIESVTCYTAFRLNRMPVPNNEADLLYRRRQLGEAAPPPPAKTADHVRGFADLNWLGRVHHREVQLEVIEQDGKSIGRGCIAIEPRR